MAVDYPYNLPIPLASKNQITAQQATYLQQVAGGAPYAKLFTSDTWESYTAGFSFSNLEYQVFKQWFIWQAQRGAIPINMNLRGSLGVTCQEVYMTVGAEVLNQNRWNVSAQIIVIRQEKMDECAAESLINVHNMVESPNWALPFMNNIIKKMV